MDHCNGASAYVLRAVISAERQEIIVNVERFVKLMTGHFDNKEQLNKIAARWPAKAVAQFYFY